MDRIPDSDPIETREWRDALDSVLAFEGADRAHFLLHELMHEARRKGAPVPYSANTPYLNTIPPDREAPHPGRPGDRAQDPQLHPLECAGDRPARQQGELASWAGTSRASSPRPCSTTPASCISGMRPPRAMAAT